MICKRRTSTSFGSKQRTSINRRFRRRPSRLCRRSKPRRATWPSASSSRTLRTIYFKMRRHLPILTTARHRRKTTFSRQTVMMLALALAVRVPRRALRDASARTLSHCAISIGSKDPGSLSRVTAWSNMTRQRVSAPSHHARAPLTISIAQAATQTSSKTYSERSLNALWTLPKSASRFWSRYLEPLSTWSSTSNRK